jgi:hypothetical protein
VIYLAGSIAIAAAVFAYVRLHSPAKIALPIVHVPRTTDAEKAGARRLFVRPDKTEAKPYSDVRLAHEGGTIHIVLYASDHDIVTSGAPADGPLWRGDDFHLVFTHGDESFAIDVDPKCTITDGKREGQQGAWNYAWQSGAKVKCDDIDGTVDQPGDNDEEWVIDLDIPMTAIGITDKDHVDLAVRRCDVKERGGKPLVEPCPQIEPVTLAFD